MTCFSRKATNLPDHGLFPNREPLVSIRGRSDRRCPARIVLLCRRGVAPQLPAP